MRLPSSLNKYWLYFVTFAVIIICIFGIFGIIALTPEVSSVLSSAGAGRHGEIDSTTYQAVFLTNNQIYFGHLDTRSKFMLLRDVYYIQLTEKSAQGRLVKLGEAETHRPTNEMIINPDHILFWENLQPDSPIVKTILNLKLQGQ